MAITTVKGEITRTFFDGKGAEVTEQYTVRGETRKTRWAAFFDAPHGLQVGQEAELSGLHGDKIDEWPDRDDPQVVRRAVKRSLNKARIVGEVQPAVTAADDTWNVPTGVGEDAPF